jgi:hypothetical protein
MSLFRPKPSTIVAVFIISIAIRAALIWSGYFPPFAPELVIDIAILIVMRERSWTRPDRP